MATPELILPPGIAASREVDITHVPQGRPVILSVKHVCGQGSIRAQINWLKADGTFIRVDAVSSPCGGAPRLATLTTTPPIDARAGHLYLVNDSSGDARLYDERAGFVANP